MDRNKSRRKRPNLESARRWLKDGLYPVSSPEFYFSDEEFEIHIKGISDELALILPRRFPRTQNLEYAVLKGHLIIEQVIRLYIACHSRVHINPVDLRFTFHQNLEIAYLMGLGVNDPILIPTIELWNRARNQVAHSFRLDCALIDEIIKLSIVDSELEPIDTDRKRIRELRRIVGWICISTAGRIEAEYYANIRQQDKADDLG